MVSFSIFMFYVRASVQVPSLSFNRIGKVDKERKSMTPENLIHYELKINTLDAFEKGGPGLKMKLGFFLNEDIKTIFLKMGEIS